MYRPLKTCGGPGSERSAGQSALWRLLAAPPPAPAPPPQAPPPGLGQRMRPARRSAGGESEAGPQPRDARRPIHAGQRRRGHAAEPGRGGGGLGLGGLRGFGGPAAKRAAAAARATGRGDGRRRGAPRGSP